jgi:hypothetical protein
MRAPYLDDFNIPPPWLNDPITFQSGIMFTHIDSSPEIEDMVYSKDVCK